jgi:hypothetical protein
MRRCTDATSQLDKLNYKIYLVQDIDTSEKLETVQDDDIVSTRIIVHEELDSKLR